MYRIPSFSLCNTYTFEIKKMFAFNNEYVLISIQIIYYSGAPRGVDPSLANAMVFILSFDFLKLLCNFQKTLLKNKYTIVGKFQVL